MEAFANRPILDGSRHKTIMPAPASNDELLELVRKSGVMDDKRLEAHVQKLREGGTLPAEPSKLASVLVRDGLLTNFQAEQLLQGKWRRFTIGKYKVLERLGSGGMGTVFLCEHKFMRRRVAVKVLPTAKAADEASLARFYREARAVAAVDHPNIVHAYDIDQDEKLHFLVMEYVDGASLQEIVKKSGPISVDRACQYISYAAQALDHANKAGLIHRDIKPGNVLVDRTGVVKILDMGLARFFNDDEDMLTRKYDENVLGTADYLAPEQADDSHTVDVRADIYSLGGTFYFLLTGRTPFGEGSVPQKLMWHRTRQPKPINSCRNDVPAEIQAIVDKMMAKEPAQRYQEPADISNALQPWTQTPVPPPPDSEMPRLCPAVTGSGASGPGSSTSVTGPGSSPGRKPWQVSGAPVPKMPSSKPSAAKPPAKPAGSTAKSSGPATASRPAQAPTVKRAPVAAVRPTPKKPPDQGETAGVAEDTANPIAKGDTPASSPARKTRPMKRPPTAPSGVNLRVWLILAALIMVIVGLLILITVGFFLGWIGEPQRSQVQRQSHQVVARPSDGCPWWSWMQACPTSRSTSL
jgi:eukaryotic-like serine/threonine-protein kinase